VKKFALLSILTMSIVFAFAQFDPQSKTIQNTSSKNNNGGYGAITLGYSRISGKGALYLGTRGGIISNRKLAFGIGGNGFANNFHVQTFLGHQPLERMLIGAYGGLYFEPIVKDKKKIHLSIPVLFGLGAAILIEDYGNENDNQINKIDSDTYSVIEPGIEMTFNLGQFFRTGAAISYRRAISFDMIETNENALNGLTFGLTFKFGKF
jgi:hypothetical protein